MFHLHELQGLCHVVLLRETERLWENWLRDFVVQISIFSMPRCLGSESPGSVSTGFCVDCLVLGGKRRRCLA